MVAPAACRLYAGNPIVESIGTAKRLGVGGWVAWGRAGRRQACHPACMCVCVCRRREGAEGGAGEQPQVAGLLPDMGAQKLCAGWEGWGRGGRKGLGDGCGGAARKICGGVGGGRGDEGGGLGLCFFWEGEGAGVQR